MPFPGRIYSHAYLEKKEETRGNIVVAKWIFEYYILLEARRWKSQGIIPFSEVSSMHSVLKSEKRSHSNLLEQIK